MEFKEEYRRIYDNLDNKEKKTFRKALLNDDMETLTPFFNRFSALDQNQTTEKAQGAEKEEKRGHKNRNKSDTHYAEYVREKKEFRKIAQPENFPSEYIEKVEGEIIADDDIEQFTELYRMVCYDVLNNFKTNNADLAKKHPYNWYKKILIGIKKNTPKITASDIDKAIAVWGVLSEILEDIGLYITYEAFEKVTSIYKYQLESRQNLSPKYADFVKKIATDTKSAMIGELSYNPYNQTNKIFLAKAQHGMIENTSPKVIEVNHNIRNYENLPMFNTDNE